MFTNNDINLDSLPKVEKHLFNSLDSRYHSVLIIKSGLFSLFLIGAYYIAFYLSDVDEILFLRFPFIVLLLVIVFLSLYVSYFGFKKKVYKLRQHDLIYRTGLWWKSETTVPFVRVQHSEVIQGPVERIFGLAKLKLYTAGGQTSDLSVPGLRPEKAEELKDFITKKIAVDEEE